MYTTYTYVIYTKVNYYSRKLICMRRSRYKLSIRRYQPEPPSIDPHVYKKIGVFTDIRSSDSEPVSTCMFFKGLAVPVIKLSLLNNGTNSENDIVVPKATC